MVQPTTKLGNRTTPKKHHPQLPHLRTHHPRPRHSRRTSHHTQTTLSRRQHHTNHPILPPLHPHPQTTTHRPTSTTKTPKTQHRPTMNHLYEQLCGGTITLTEHTQDGLQLNILEYHLNDTKTFHAFTLTDEIRKNINKYHIAMVRLLYHKHHIGTPLATKMVLDTIQKDRMKNPHKYTNTPTTRRITTNTPNTSS